MLSSLGGDSYVRQNRAITIELNGSERCELKDDDGFTRLCDTAMLESPLAVLASRTVT